MIIARCQVPGIREFSVGACADEVHTRYAARAIDRRMRVRFSST
jgi:hypothetical protein